MAFSTVLRSNQPLTRLPLSTTDSPPPPQKYSTLKDLPSHDSKKEELELSLLTFTQKCPVVGRPPAFQHHTSTPLTGHASHILHPLQMSSR